MSHFITKNIIQILFMTQSNVRIIQQAINTKADVQ